MLRLIKIFLSKLNQHLSLALNEANSGCDVLNTQHYVDWCHPIFVDIPQWHTESVGELAVLMSQSSHS